MIRRLVSVALHQPLYVALLLVLFVAAGIAAFRSLPVEAFLDVDGQQDGVAGQVEGKLGGGHYATPLRSVIRTFPSWHKSISTVSPGCRDFPSS